MATFNPTVGGSLGKNYTGAPVESATSDAVYDQQIIQAGQFGVGTMNELLGLWAAAIAPSTLGQAYTMTSFTGTVGQPVIIDPSNDNSVLPANSLTSGSAAVFGFISQISAANPSQCFVAFISNVTGSGFTRGNAVYLSDAGGYSASAGTVTRQLGKAITTTTAIVSSLSALTGN
jgi:hypothetical protein